MAPRRRPLRRPSPGGPSTPELRRLAAGKCTRPLYEKRVTAATESFRRILGKSERPTIRGGAMDANRLPSRSAARVPPWGQGPVDVKRDGPEPKRVALDRRRGFRKCPAALGRRLDEGIFVAPVTSATPSRPGQRGGEKSDLPRNRAIGSRRGLAVRGSAPRVPIHLPEMAFLAPSVPRLFPPPGRRQRGWGFGSPHPANVAGYCPIASRRRCRRRSRRRRRRYRSRRSRCRSRC